MTVDSCVCVYNSTISGTSDLWHVVECQAYVKRETGIQFLFKFYESNYQVKRWIGSELKRVMQKIRESVQIFIGRPTPYTSILTMSEFSIDKKIY